MKIAIIGTGYVGLITGVSLAKVGNQVTCFDTNKSIIDKINQSNPHIYEKGLNEILEELLAKKTFKAKLFDCDLEGFDIIILAVGTPSKEDGEINLDYISKASVQIGRSIKKTNKFVSIIIKSTVLPGTTDTIIREIIEKESGKKLGDFGLGMNPEFLREGNAIQDVSNPDRIIMGYENNRTLKHLEKLYEPWDCDKIKVNTRTAEMIKYANNSILATQISMVNEIANIITRIGGIDVVDVLEGVYKDKRWSPILDGKRIKPEILNYLKPGCGFGGSCFPKDIKALKQKSISLGLEPLIINAVIKTNDTQPSQIIKILKQHYKTLSDKTFLILGLAFKPFTDDVRESVSIKIINYLQKENCQVIVHDPIAIENCKKVLGYQKRIKYTERWEKEIINADSIIVLTEWPEYLKLSDKKYLKCISKKIIFDARRMFKSDDLPSAIHLSFGKNV